MSYRRHHHRDEHCKEKDKYIKNLKTKNIKVHNACIKNLKTKNVKTDNINAECSSIKCADVKTLDVDKLYVNGTNVTCSLLAPAVSSFRNTFVDIGQTGATGPANVDPVVFDALIANAYKNQQALQCRLYDGRCCIYKYLQEKGCPESCPPPAGGTGPAACYINFTGSISGNTLTVTGPLGLSGLEIDQIVSGNGVLPNTAISAQVSGVPGGVGEYTVTLAQNIAEGDLQAVQDCASECPLAPIPLKIFGAMTFPIYEIINCGSTGATGATGANCGCIGVTGPSENSYRSINTAVNFNLQCTYLLEQANSIDARAVSVLVQVGAYDSVTDSVVIEEVFIANKQLYPTLDVLYGENFANTISIPTSILSFALDKSRNPNKQGAIQLVVYEEEGICIWNPTGDGNFECRGGGGSSNAPGGNQAQASNCVRDYSTGIVTCQ